MSGRDVLVIADDLTTESITYQVCPFQRLGLWRSKNFFKVLDGRRIFAVSAPRPLLFVFTPPSTPSPYLAAAAQKRDIDFDGMRKSAGDLAARLYDSAVLENTVWPDRDGFIARAMARAVRATAVIANCEWFDSDATAWFGGISGQMREEEWDRRYNEMLEALPETAVLAYLTYDA